MSRRRVRLFSSESPNPIPSGSPNHLPSGSPNPIPSSTPNPNPNPSAKFTPNPNPNLSARSTPNPDHIEHTPLKHTPLKHKPLGSQSREHTPARSYIGTHTENGLLLVANGNNEWARGSMHTDGRMRVQVICGVLEPSGKCAHKIRGVMYERLEPTGFNWKSISNETKQFYFEEFKKHVVWREPDKVFYSAWLKSARNRYKDLVCKARRHWERNGQPASYIGMAVWLRWIKFWKTPQFETKSAIQKKNRCGGYDAPPPTHTERTVKKDPNPIDVFDRTHKPKDRDGYINDKSKRIHETVESLVLDQSTQIAEGSRLQTLDENALYLEAVDKVAGPNKKNMIFRIGSSQDLFYGPGKYANNSTICAYKTEDNRRVDGQLKMVQEQLLQIQEQQQQMQLRQQQFEQQQQNLNEKQDHVNAMEKN